jgi:hypothetical protein
MDSPNYDVKQRPPPDTSSADVEDHAACFSSRPLAAAILTILCLAGGGSPAAQPAEKSSDTPAQAAVFRPSDYGAKADEKTVNDASILAGSAALSSPTAAFTAADAGKHVCVIGAGPDGEALVSRIVAVQSPASVTLSAAAAGSVSHATIHWATDDRAAIQATIDAASQQDESVVDFGASSYWIATAVPSPWYETTGIDVSSSARRKSIRLVGQGARLICRQITGKGHTSILQVRNNWDYVDFEGLEFRWEDLKDVSASFEWWEGIRFCNLAPDNVDMERLSICKCLFWDCNRAWTITARSGPIKTTRGRLKHVLVRDCHVLCPRGSNWRFLGGGSQGEYMGNWVRLGEVIDCTFDGAMGGDVSGTVAKKPKDGFLMGEPLHRVWRGGVARHFDLEGAYCNVQNGIGRATFIVPRVGESVTLDHDQIGAAQVDLGEIVRIDQIGAFKVTAKQGDRVTLENLGTYTSKNGLATVTNVPPGSAARSNYIALDGITGEDCSVLVEGVRFEGKVWTGTTYRSAHPCVRVDNMRSTIRNCVAIDPTVFTLNYQVPAEKWLTAFWRTPSDLKTTEVCGNCIVLADADEVHVPFATGIHGDFSRNAAVRDNVIVSPRGKKFRGIDGNTSGRVLLENNLIMALGLPEPTSFGITYNVYGDGTVVTRGNTFRNLGHNTSGRIRDEGTRP